VAYIYAHCAISRTHIRSVTIIRHHTQSYAFIHFQSRSYTIIRPHRKANLAHTPSYALIVAFLALSYAINRPQYGFKRIQTHS